MLKIILGLIGAALLLADDKEVAAPAETKKRKYSKAFILSAGRWLKENKPPEDWDGSKLEFAATEMPYEGEVYE